MKFLSCKTKKDAVEFSREFYDHSVFCSDLFGKNYSPDPTGGTPFKAIAESASRYASEADATFSEVPLAELTDELLGLRLEMIGTAWTDASKEAAALANSVFTKKYLAEIDRLDLWEVMGEYNAVIANSAVYPDERKTPKGIVRMASVNEYRFKAADKLYRQGHGSDSLGRIVGRYLWTNREMTYAMLAMQLIGRLKFQGSTDVIVPLAAVSYGFYQGAREALVGVKLTA